MAGDDAMTPKAAEAFAAYVAMGPGRSLRNLADHLVQQKVYKSSTAALAMLGRWSVRYHWQARLSAATTTAAEVALASAAEIDAHSYLRTSALLAAVLAHGDALPLNAVLSIRDAVRKPEPRGAAVHVTLAATLRGTVERIAAEQGLDPDEVLAEAERILGDGAG